MLMTSGSYFQNKNGKHCAGYAVVTPFEVIEAASLPLANLAQQAELCSHPGLYFSQGQNCQHL